jgi:hypothetical protein
VGGCGRSLRVVEAHTELGGENGRAKLPGSDHTQRAALAPEFGEHPAKRFGCSHRKRSEADAEQ